MTAKLKGGTINHALKILAYQQGTNQTIYFCGVNSMTNSNYTALIEQLKTIHTGNSDSQCRKNYNNACHLIRNSELEDSEINSALKVLRANCDSNGGYHYNSDGIPELLAHLEAAQEVETNNEALNVPAFNLRNFTALVSDGKIFSVEFIKRTTGELRRMTCRIGVKKHLKGGEKAYSAAQKRLLTVFDMDAKGYRSIPLEGIQSVSVGGQTFSFGGA